LLLGIVIAALSMAARGGERDEATVAALDAQLNDLIKSHAAASAASYYADAFALTTGSGARKSRIDMVGQIGAPGLVLAVNETRDVQVRVLRDTAVLTATLHQQGTLDGSAFDVELWVTDTWVRGGEHGWTLLAGQATRIEKKS